MMSIWFKPFTADDLNQRGKNTLACHLGIEFTDVGEDSPHRYHARDVLHKTAARHCARGSERCVG